MHNYLSWGLIKQGKVYENFILIMLSQIILILILIIRLTISVHQSAKNFPFTKNTSQFLLPVAEVTDSVTTGALNSIE